MRKATVVRSCAVVAVAAISAVGLSVVTSQKASAESGTAQFTRDSVNWGGVGGGGEFGCKFVSGGLTMPAQGAGVQIAPSDFQTFCLENNEVLPYAEVPNYGDIVDWTLNTGAVNGGLSGQTLPGFDPISNETAYLYTRFWDGNLPNYDYTPGAGRRTSAGELQFAIWHLEGEFSADLTANGHVQAQAWVDLATANAGADIGDVRVLNVTLAGDLKQDVLVRVTQPTTNNNDPRTIGFWGNKNGKKLIGSDDLAMLSALCLRDGSGNDFNPTTFDQLDKWLQGAKAVNMAYMLSAQLAGMELNVFNGKVDADSVVYAPGCGFVNDNATIQELMDAAEAELCAHPHTTVTGADSAFRQIQAALEQALDNANNNLNFI